MSYEADNPFEETSDNPFEDNSNSSPSSRKSSTSSNKNTGTLRNNTQQNSTLRNSPQVPKKPVQTNDIRIDVNNDVNEDAIRRKEAELKRREEDLNRREEMMKKREQEIGKGMKKPNNWPFFKPMLVYDIAELPQEQQKMVRASYYIWIITTIVFLYNVAVMLGALIEGGGNLTGGFILSIVYFFFFVPIFFLIFRLLYNASRKNKSALFLSYMISKGFEFLVIIWLGIGVYGWGSGGLLLMFKFFQAKYTAIGIMALVNSVLWACLFMVYCYQVLHARMFYVAAGGYGAAKKQGKEFAVETARDNPKAVSSVANTAYSIRENS